MSAHQPIVRLAVFCAVVFTSACQTAKRDEVQATPERTNGRGAYKIAELDSSPTRTKKTEPVYPQALVGERIEGDAVVQIIVDKRGVPVEVQCTKASNPLFAAAAVAAVNEWRFTPGIKDGVPVSATLSIPIKFYPPSTAPKLSKAARASIAEALQRYAEYVLSSIDEEPAGIVKAVLRQKSDSQQALLVFFEYREGAWKEIPGKTENTEFLTP